MLDIDYLGEVNNPDGLPGLYDQASKYLASASRPEGNMVGNCEMLQYLRSSRRYCRIFAVHDAVLIRRAHFYA
eukprot:3365704-Pleurochrysis_carterae.AAC.1